MSMSGVAMVMDHQQRYGTVHMSSRIQIANNDLQVPAGFANGDLLYQPLGFGIRRYSPQEGVQRLGQSFYEGQLRQAFEIDRRRTGGLVTSPNGAKPMLLNEWGVAEHFHLPYNAGPLARNPVTDPAAFSHAQFGYYGQQL